MRRPPASLGSGGRRDVCQSWERVERCQSCTLSQSHHVAELWFMFATALPVRDPCTQTLSTEARFSAAHPPVRLDTASGPSRQPRPVSRLALPCPCKALPGLGGAWSGRVTEWTHTWRGLLCLLPSPDVAGSVHPWGPTWGLLTPAGAGDTPTCGNESCCASSPVGLCADST